MAALRRFAIVAPNFYPRTCGVGDHSARLAGELRKRGHEVTIYSRAPAAAHPDAPDIEAVGAAGRFPMAIARALGEAMAARAPTDVIVQFTPQMWDAWRFGSPALVWLAARARRAGARVTLIAHELHVPWQRRPDLITAAALQRVQLAALLAICHRVFVTTETRLPYVAPMLRLLGAAAPGVIRVGPNALPPATPGTAARAARAAQSPVIGVFSTGGAGKRLDVAMDAFARIAAELPEARMVLIGDLGGGDPARAAAVAADIARHPAGARVRVTGKLPLAGVAAEVAALDLYLFTMDTGVNTRSGTLPVALGSGVPVVGVVGADTDLMLFRDGENVGLARALDGAAFAEAALRLLRDPAAAARIADGGRRLYDEHLSWGRITDGLLAQLR